VKIRTILHSPPQRRSFQARAIFGLLVAVVAVGAFATASFAQKAGTPLSGELHVTKECSEYFGHAGEFCTITGSNLNAIDAGTKVIYTSAAGANGLHSDLVLDGPGNDDAYGHVTLSFLTASGVVAFSGGTGGFSGFRARVAVTYHSDDQLWHWDGTYRFIPSGDDG
jgi:hypothetical protein